MALEDAQGNYINGFRPGTTTPAQAQADGAFKAASKAAQALKKGKTPATGPIEPNPPMHHVNAKGEATAEQTFSHAAASLGQVFDSLMPRRRLMVPSKQRAKLPKP